MRRTTIYSSLNTCMPISDNLAALRPHNIRYILERTDFQRKVNESFLLALSSLHFCELITLSKWYSSKNAIVRNAALLLGNWSRKTLLGSISKQSGIGRSLRTWLCVYLVYQREDIYFNIFSGLFNIFSARLVAFSSIQLRNMLHKPGWEHVLYFSFAKLWGSSRRTSLNWTRRDELCGWLTEGSAQKTSTCIVLDGLVEVRSGPTAEAADGFEHRYKLRVQSTTSSWQTAD